MTEKSSALSATRRHGLFKQTNDGPHRRMRFSRSFFPLHYCTPQFVTMVDEESVRVRSADKRIPPFRFWRQGLMRLAMPPATSSSKRLSEFQRFRICQPYGRFGHKHLPRVAGAPNACASHKKNQSPVPTLGPEMSAVKTAENIPEHKHPVMQGLSWATLRQSL